MNAKGQHAHPRGPPPSYGVRGARARVRARALVLVVGICACVGVSVCVSRVLLLSLGSAEDDKVLVG